VSTDRVLNFDDDRERARVAAGIQRMRGRWRMGLCRYRPRRSDRQNRYYWPCFVEPYAQLLSDHAGERVTADDAHEDLKRRHLRRPLIDRRTGVLIAEVVGSTAKLNTAEFNEYLDRCAGFLAGLDIVVPEPDVYRERDAATAGDLMPA
jgi:hypothetical protein